MWFIERYSIGGNVYITLELIGFTASLIGMVTPLVVMLILERKFIEYIKNNDHNLWKKYRSFQPSYWWRFLAFLRPLENMNDSFLRELRSKLLRCEKLASISLLSMIGFVFLIIITIIITEQ